MVNVGAMGHGTAENGVNRRDLPLSARGGLNCGCALWLSDRAMVRAARPSPSVIATKRKTWGDVHGWCLHPTVAYCCIGLSKPNRVGA